MMPTLILLGILIVMGFSYMFFLAHHDHLRYETITHKSIPPSFHGYNILFIADIHRRKLNPKTFKKLIKTPDMVCIAGDLIERGVPFSRMRANIKVLKQWNTPVYFVWGNNDYEREPNEMIRLLKEENIIILEDDMHVLHRNQEKMNILGFDYYFDYFNETSLIDWSVVDDSFTILLIHNPRAYEILHEEAKSKIDLVLAGHTHGGQIRLFGFGPYKRGSLIHSNRTFVLTTEGYGYSLLPLRLGTRAECHLLTLQGSNY